jgi:peptide/nickel transport system substrate-binding protein
LPDLGDKSREIAKFFQLNISEGLMKKSKAVKFGMAVYFLAAIISACSAQPASSPVAVPSKTPTMMPTATPTNTPSPTPSPTPTPLYYVRADSQSQSTDPNTFTYAGSLFEIFDPTWTFGEIIQNVYETLVFYDEEKPDVFIPFLAKSWEVSPDGTTYTFHMREGVKFHNGDSLTASDVAYSFQRGLLEGGDYEYLFSEPFFNPGTLDVAWLVDSSGKLVGDNEGMKRADPEKLKSVCEKVKSIIVADDSAGTVTMHLSQAWNAFLPAVAHPSASIMDAKWVAENGGWDGSCDTWQKFYAVWDNPFAQIENGTGPFKLTYWGLFSELVLIRNDDYWREPAKLQRVNIKYYGWDWNPILSMMKSNTADAVSANNTYQKEMEEFVGERCEYNSLANVYKPCEVVDETKSYVLFSGKPANGQEVLLFNFNNKGSYGNPAIGSARLDGKGIPSDFFSDVHIRKAFAYCLDRDTFINDAYGGKAAQSSQLLLPGMPGFNPDIPQYQFDLAACEKEFKLADVDKDGIPAGEDPDDVWEVGFQFMLPYDNTSTIKHIAKTLAKNINTVNPKFIVDPEATDLYDFVNPMFLGGGTEDIHDPYNWFQVFTTGYYSEKQSLPDDLKAQFREIFNRALAESDPLKRAEIYKEASLLYNNEAIGLPLALTTDNYFWQRWDQGMVLNPFFPTSYFYPIYKK